MFLRDRHLFREMLNAFTMKFNDFPWARPDTFATIRTPLVDNADLRLQQFDRVLRAHANATTAEIAFPGDEINH